ncbi:MAG: low molecular weight protein-tyrosine-phosphatase [Cyclobacteriaceae bacterium]
MIKVLFVCLGNICRSPMAEAVFNALLSRDGLEDKISSDSAGTSDYHIGSRPDPRTMDVVQEKKLQLDHLARQFSSEDFEGFDYIIAMDQSNRNNILSLTTDDEVKKKVFLMREFEDNADALDVPDPYWSERNGFIEVHDILLRSCRNLLDYIKKEHRL